MFTTLMRRSALVLGFIGSLTAGLAAERRADHVFIISIDGGKPAVIHQSEMPTLNRIVKEGAHTWVANTVFPSITLPSHTSMLTGVDIVKHQITWNNWVQGAGFVKVPTVFTEAKKAGLTTAMFAGKEKFKHLAIPGSIDYFEYNKGQSGETVKIDAKGKKTVKEGTVPAKIVAADAAAYIKQAKPNLCVIHFPDTDSTGHKYGWGSPEQIAAFAEVDRELNTVFTAIREAGIADKSVVFISADHGGHDKTHGSNAPEDMNIPWIAWGKGVRVGADVSEPVKTYDTAATALWLLGVALPEGFDGHPVQSVFQ
jgi:predicted AlkP superfamily pyrophosphatase or phosphodiesterase